MTPQSDLVSAHDALEDWLHRLALPLWSGIGCDRAWGGFFEQLDHSGTVLDGPRRSRLVARQIYVFAEAGRMGWSGPAREMAGHGLDFLLRHQLRPDGLARLHVRPDTQDDTFDLYDQAFVLFAFAAAARIDGRDAEMLRHADRLWQSLTPYRHTVRGFHEGAPEQSPLRANPHMHLFEAALAIREIAPDHPIALFADELAELCMEALVSPGTGVVHEYFDGDWRPLRDLPHGMIEPGHQYEWGWLLLRWVAPGGRADAIEKATRMIALAERHGVSRAGLAINGLAADLSPHDLRHRLWPQTERIKAHVEMARQASSSADRDKAEGLAAESARGLMRFFDHPVAGAWWEHLDVAGDPIIEPTRASSLYHIMCAFRTMSGYVADRTTIEADDARSLV